VTVAHVRLRVDAGPGIGGGHLSRCLALAHALRALGAGCTVTSARFTPADRARIESSGTRFVALAAGADRAPAADANDVPSVMVVDHYGLGARFEAAWRARGVPVVVIDDLADRDHDCDLLIDQAWGVEPASYTARVPQNCRLLLGTAYALLAPAFAAARAARGDAVASIRGPLRVHVWFGSDDAAGCTRRFVPRLLAQVEVAQVVAVLRGAHPDRRALETLAAVSGGRLRLVVDAPDLAASLATCDVAIGAPGQATWERACLGVPAAYVSVATNQAPIVARLAQAGFCADLGPLDRLDDAHFEAAAAAFLADRARLAEWQALSLAACDGRGAQRVAAAVVALAKAHA
jgi:UDP-2,4-diacetamido-2,4,6-trideoxy-beta-L-altropyranose hydrolase